MKRKRPFKYSLLIIPALIIFCIFLLYYFSAHSSFFQGSADCNYTADLHKFYVDSDICGMFNEGKSRVPVMVTVWNPEDANPVLQSLSIMEFALDAKSPDGFSGDITLKGFEILKNDARVRNIEYARSGEFLRK